MSIEIKFKQANFVALPLSKKNTDPKPYGMIEFMGGSLIVNNNSLLPSTEGADYVLCKGGMMRGQLMLSEVLDIVVSGKSIQKTFKTA